MILSHACLPIPAFPRARLYYHSAFGFASIIFKKIFAKNFRFGVVFPKKSGLYIQGGNISLAQGAKMNYNSCPEETRREAADKYTEEKL